MLFAVGSSVFQSPFIDSAFRFASASLRTVHLYHWVMDKPGEKRDVVFDTEEAVFAGFFDTVAPEFGSVTGAPIWNVRTGDGYGDGGTFGRLPGFGPRLAFDSLTSSASKKSPLRTERSELRVAPLLAAPLAIDRAKRAPRCFSRIPAPGSENEPEIFHNRQGIASSQGNS